MPSHDGSEANGSNNQHRSIPAPPRGFIPFFDDDNNTLMHLRHGALPALIRSETSAQNLGLPEDLRRRGSLAVQRQGSIRGGENGHGDAGSDIEACQRAAEIRSRRLIGQNNSKYHWEQYLKKEKDLKGLKKSVRKYHERNNALIHQYLYIDQLLDSSIPHFLIQEYHFSQHPSRYDPSKDTSEDADREDGKRTASHAEARHDSRVDTSHHSRAPTGSGDHPSPVLKVKRTPKALYSLPSSERSPLLGEPAMDGDDDEHKDSNLMKFHKNDKQHTADEARSESSIAPGSPSSEFGGYDDAGGGNSVKWAIYVNTFANFVLLILKLIVILLTSSLSVLASLVDAALDFLSTGIIWLTTWLISRKSPYHYPTGRRKLEPLGVLVFAIIIIISFLQIMVECFQRLIGNDHSIVQLTIPAIAIMVSTILVKGACWFYCHLIPDSSVQALAQDAITDVFFNTFSIIFPLIGYYAQLWWMDPLGGLLLSFVVVLQWSHTSFLHIRRLSGHAATANQRNVLLYLTMRFAESIKQVQGLQAYHAGDRLIIEVDIVLDPGMELKDSHDVAESLQYMLESVPYVDRVSHKSLAFVGHFKR